uniref:Uncharacterized protein n=1 Tax=Rhizophora mucronata TaxID=61149 RepID=A0A2P2JIZ5_RHIMU
MVISIIDLQFLVTF